MQKSTDRHEMMGEYKSVGVTATELPSAVAELGAGQVNHELPATPFHKPALPHGENRR